MVIFAVLSLTRLWGKKSQMSAVRAVESCLNQTGLNLQSTWNCLRVFIDPLSCSFYTVAVRLKQPWYALTATRMPGTWTGANRPLKRSCKFGLCQWWGHQVISGWGVLSFHCLAFTKSSVWNHWQEKRENPARLSSRLIFTCNGNVIKNKKNPEFYKQQSIVYIIISIYVVLYMYVVVIDRTLSYL